MSTLDVGTPPAGQARGAAITVAGAEGNTSPNRPLPTSDEPALQVVTVGSFRRVDGIAALVIARKLPDGA